MEGVSLNLCPYPAVDKGHVPHVSHVFRKGRFVSRVILLAEVRRQISPDKLFHFFQLLPVRLRVRLQIELDETSSPVQA